jgi:hypothetical protein
MWLIDTNKLATNHSLASGANNRTDSGKEAIEAGPDTGLGLLDSFMTGPPTNRVLGVS